MRWSLLLFSTLIGAALYGQPTEQDWAGDEAILRNLNLPTKGDGLLQIFRDRTPKADLVEEFQKHAAKLGSTNFQERTKASDDLLKMGPVIRPLLEALIAEGKLELETKRRMQQLLTNFPPEKDITATATAARLLLRDKRADRLQVLLDFAPHAANEYVRQEVQLAINEAALEDKKPAPLILAALKDETPAKRAAAAEAIVRSLGADKAKEHVAALLKDEHPLVRYQLSTALVEKQDKSGLPYLIASLRDPSSERVDFVLELLYRTAGDTAPPDNFQGKKNLDKFVAAWEGWHKKHEAKLDLSKIGTRTELGYTLVSMYVIKGKAAGKIVELGPRPQNAVRWEFEAGRNTVDMQILGPNRLLLTEYTERRVTERDFKGNILKTFNANLPISAQRLPNGKTFIVTRQQIQIVDSEGQPTFTWNAQPNLIMAAQRTRNGQMVVLSTNGVCQLLDADGKELKRFNTGNNASVIGANIEVLPNGNVLIPLYTQQIVAEFDWTGAKVWQAQTQRPLSVTRLSNGNTLVTTSLTPYRLIEIDRNGQEVWSMNTEGRALRARRR